MAPCTPRCTLAAAVIQVHTTHHHTHMVVARPEVHQIPHSNQSVGTNSLHQSPHALRALLCSAWLPAQVTNVCVLDENPEGLEGPWVTYARMWTLRTNKSLTGRTDAAAAGGTLCRGSVSSRLPFGGQLLAAQCFLSDLCDLHRTSFPPPLSKTILPAVPPVFFLLPFKPSGPDLGVPSLTFQAFYEAKYGEAAWEALDKIPKECWMAYLLWYR